MIKYEQKYTKRCLEKQDEIRDGVANNHGGENATRPTVERLGIRTKKPTDLGWAINKIICRFIPSIYRVEPSETVSLHARISMNGSVLQSEEFVSEYAVES